jgi:hypothetical protein
MADSPAFDWICKELESVTSLDRLESRGTIRLALRSAGLDADSVLPDQMRVVIEKLLPRELSIRGVANAETLCVRLGREVVRIESDPEVDSPDEVFRRFGSS